MPEFTLRSARGVAGQAMEKVPAGISQPALLSGGAITAGVGVGLALGVKKAATIGAISSVVGGSTAAVGLAGAGAAVVVGAAGAGAVDIVYRVYNCQNTFFRPMNHISQARDKLVTVAASPFVAAYLAVEQALAFCAYLIQAIGYAMTCNGTKSGEALGNAGGSLRDASLNLAGTVLFPILNLFDLGGSMIASCFKKTEEAEGDKLSLDPALKRP